MICNLYWPDGTPYKNSPRYILERVAEEAEQEGYTCYIDPECEFFLFHTDDNGNPTTVTHEKAGYLDMSPLDLGENARRDMVLTLEDMGMEVESSHHEAAPAQHEIDFSYGEIRDIADCIMTFKMAVRIVAKRHGLHATFMPKPRAEVNGSGMHIQFSVFKNGRNLFEDADHPGELSEEARYFIGGLLAHSKEMALITNPLVNSYKRLVPGYDAPTELTWTENNQNSLVRIPVTRGEGTRVELRSPDASSIRTWCLQYALQPDWMGSETKFLLQNRQISQHRIRRQSIFRKHSKMRSSFLKTAPGSGEYWAKNSAGLILHRRKMSGCVIPDR